MADIDELRIKIESEAGEAASNINKLAANLTKLKTSISGLEKVDLSGFKNKISEITNIVKPLANEMAKVAEGAKVMGGSMAKSMAKSMPTEAKAKSVAALGAMKTSFEEVRDKLIGLGEAGAEMLPKVESALKAIENTDTTSLKSMQETLGSLTESIEGLKDATPEELFTDFAPELDATQEALSSFKDTLSDASAEAESLDFSKGIIAVGVALKGASEAAKQAIAPLRNMYKLLKGMTSAGITAIGASLRGASTAARAMLRPLQAMPGIIRGIIQGLGRIVGIVTGIGKAFSQANRQAGFFSTFIGRALKSIVLYRVIRRIFTNIAMAFREGTRNVTQFSDAAQRAMSSIVTDTLYLRNAFGALAAPALEVIAPIFRRITDAIVAATNALAQFMALLMGRSTFVRAKRELQEYGAAAGGAARQLRSMRGAFDELNVLEDTGGAGAGAGGIGDWFEYVDIGEGMREFMDALMGPLDELRAYFYQLGRSIGEYINNGLRAIPWDEIQDTANRIAMAVSWILNGIISAVDWDLIGHTIAQALNTIIGAFATFAEEFNFKPAGDAIAEAVNAFFRDFDFSRWAAGISAWTTGILDMIINAMDGINWTIIGTKVGDALGEIDWYGIFSRIGKAAGKSINALSETLSSAVSRFNFKDFGQSIASGVNNAVNAINWGSAGAAASDLTLGLLSSFIAAVSDVNWNTIGKRIGDMLNAISWRQIFADAGTAAGKMFSGFVETLASAAERFDFSAFGTGLSVGINNLFENYDFGGLAQSINAWVLGVLDAITAAIGGANWRRIGDNVGELLSGINWQGIFTRVGNAAGATINALVDTLGAAVRAFNFAAFGRDVGNGINDAISSINWSKAGRTISDIAIGLLSVFQEAIRRVNWSAVGKSIGQFLSSIDWRGIIRAVFNVITEAFQAVFQALSEVIGKPLAAILLGSVTAIQTFITAMTGFLVLTAVKGAIKVLGDVFLKLGMNVKASLGGAAFIAIGAFIGVVAQLSNISEGARTALYALASAFVAVGVAKKLLAGRVADVVAWFQLYIPHIIKSIKGLKLKTAATTTLAKAKTALAVVSEKMWIAMLGKAGLVIAAIAAIVTIIVRATGASRELSAETQELVNAIEDSRKAYNDRRAAMEADTAATNRNIAALRNHVAEANRAASGSEQYVAAMSRAEIAANALGFSIEGLTQSQIDLRLAEMELSNAREWAVLKATRLNDAEEERAELTDRVREKTIRLNYATARQTDHLIEWGRECALLNLEIGDLDRELRVLSAKLDDNSAEFYALKESTETYRLAAEKAAQETRHLAETIQIEAVEAVRDLMGANGEMTEAAIEEYLRAKEAGLIFCEEVIAGMNELVDAHRAFEAEQAAALQHASDVYNFYADVGVNAFRRVSEEAKTSVEEMIETLRHNREMTAGWGANIAEIAERATTEFAGQINENVIGELQEAARTCPILAAEIANASADEFLALADEFRLGAIQARENAEAEIGDTTGLVAAATEAGSSIPRGVAEGILQDAGYPAHVVSQMTDDTILALLRGMGTNSPSTYGIEAGASIPAGVSRGITQNQSSAINTIRTFATNLVNTMRAAIGGSDATVFKNEIGAPMITGIIQGITREQSRVGETLMRMLDNVRNAMTARLPEFLNFGRDVVARVITGMLSEQSRLVSTASNIMREKMNAMLNIINTTAPQIITAITNMMNSIVSAATNGMSSMVAAINSGMGSVASAVNNGMSSTVNAARGFIGQFNNLGRDMMLGLRDGINNNSGVVATAMRNAVQGAINAGRDAARSMSPSRETMALGKDLMLGGAIGIIDNVKFMVRAMSDAMKDVLDTTSNFDMFEGISDSIKDATKSMVEFADTLKDIDRMSLATSAIFSAEPVQFQQRDFRIGNNAEMSETIASSVFEAVMSALAGQSERPLQAHFKVDIDGREVHRSMQTVEQDSGEEIFNNGALFGLGY